EAPAAERASITTLAGGQVGLNMEEPFDRAWRRIGLALDRIGFTVQDRDRNEGLYFVRYVDPEAESASSGGGFLSKLGFWRSDDENPVAAGSEYRLCAAGEGDLSSVTVLT